MWVCEVEADLELVHFCNKDLVRGIIIDRNIQICLWVHMYEYLCKSKVCSKLNRNLAPSSGAIYISTRIWYPFSTSSTNVMTFHLSEVK